MLMWNSGNIVKLYEYSVVTVQCNIPLCVFVFIFLCVSSTYLLTIWCGSMFMYNYLLRLL